MDDFGDDYDDEYYYDGDYMYVGDSYDLAVSLS